jgi:hypothetical protein
MPLDGHGAACFIVNVEYNDQIPIIAEPLFLTKNGYIASLSSNM